MSKRSARHLSKKGLVGLRRAKNLSGKRVWFYKGSEFETLREVVIRYWKDQLEAMEKLDTKNA